MIKGIIVIAITIGIIILLSLIQIILGIVLYISISNLKKRSEKDSDIIISGFKAFNFTESSSSKPRYYPSSANLGLAGKLYLDCYSGICDETYTETEQEYNCDDDGYCTHEYVDVEYTNHDIVEACSKQCSELKKSHCDVCPNKYNSRTGYCSRKTDDDYKSGKVCFGDNIIYFWKGKKYDIENIKAFQTKNYTYANDAKLKEEECPMNTKNCGILDDNENKLCLPYYSDCPINMISETKLNENYYYSSAVIGDKKFYYTYDNTSNRKIIAGLYADSDLYLNKDEKDFIILDTYTISGLLNENSKLYKGVNLGYDPYTISDIDKKGKSYLKVRYNAKNPDLAQIRKEHKQSIINKKMNEEVIKHAKDGLEMNIFAFIGDALLIISLPILFNLININEKSRTSSNLILKSPIIACNFFIFIILLEFTLIGTAIPLKNIHILNKAKEIDKNDNYVIIRIINLIFVICGLSICGLILIFLVLQCFIVKFKKSSIESETKSNAEFTINDLGNDKNIVEITSNNISNQNIYDNKNNLNSNTIQNINSTGNYQ